MPVGNDHPPLRQLGRNQHLIHPAMESTTPRSTRTHSSDESEGQHFGVPTRLLVWVVPVVLIAAGAFLRLSQTVGVPQAAGRTLLPAALLILGIRLAQGWGPVGFLLDGVRQLFWGGDASPEVGDTHSGGSLFSPLPDGYLSDGMLVFGGLGGHVACGFWIDFPDLRNASFSERNRAQETWSAVLRLVPEEWSVQIAALEDTRSLAPELVGYGERTQKVRNPVARGLRNANFRHLWSLLESGHLRRRRLVLFVGFRLSGEADDALLSSSRVLLANWGQTLGQLLERQNGRATPMDSGDLIQLWSDALSPSSRKGRPSNRHFDPARSLLGNLWNSEIRGSHSPGFLLDGVYHLSLCLKRLPSETYFGILQAISHLPFPGTTVTAQIRRVPKEPLLQRCQAKLERLHRQQRTKPNPRLAVAQAQLESKIHRLSALGVAPLELELVVTVRAETPAELLSYSAAVKAAIHRMSGAQAFEATLPTSSRSLFSKGLPGWMWSPHEGYRHYLEDPNAADLLPLVGSFSGHPAPTEALFPSADGGVANVVTFLGEGSSSTPQNLVVLGTAGSGKSAVVTKLLLETADDVAFTAIVESGLSQAPFSRAHGAEPALFKTDGSQTINFLSTHGSPRTPFFLATGAAVVARMVGVPKDEDRAQWQQALITRALTRVLTEHAEECLRVWPDSRREALLRHGAVLQRSRERPSTPLSEAFLEFEALRHEFPDRAKAELASVSDMELRKQESEHPGEILDLLFAHLAPEEHLTLSSLKEALELSDEEDCRRLSVLLEPYCRFGPHGALFDGPTNVAQDARVLHFELGLIPEASRELEGIVGFIAINRIRDRCLSMPKALRKRVVIDEVSRFLAVPGGEAILRELFEGFRKHNTQVVIIGQQYARIADSPIRAAIVGNTRCWIVFNTGDPKDIARLGDELGLSSAIQEAIGRFARPDQMSGTRFSEFLYLHSNPPRPVCGIVRYHLLPTELPSQRP